MGTNLYYCKKMGQCQKALLEAVETCKLKDRKCRFAGKTEGHEKKSCIWCGVWDCGGGWNMWKVQ